MEKKYEGYHKTIRYRKEIYARLKALKVKSGIPITKLVHLALDNYLPVLESIHKKK